MWAKFSGFPSRGNSDGWYRGLRRFRVGWRGSETRAIGQRVGHVRLDGLGSLVWGPRVGGIRTIASLMMRASASNGMHTYSMHKAELCSRVTSESASCSEKLRQRCQARSERASFHAWLAWPCWQHALQPCRLLGTFSSAGAPGLCSSTPPRSHRAASAAEAEAQRARCCCAPAA